MVEVLRRWFGARRTESVEVRMTPVGKGVFALEQFEVCESVGVMEGDLVTGAQACSEYAVEMGDEQSLLPHEPFRYLNHSCDPNCQLIDWEDEDGTSTEEGRLDVVVRRTILPGEEITIDYAWPADAAIECQCGSEHCRGWIVDIDELDALQATMKSADLATSKVLESESTDLSV